MATYLGNGSGADGLVTLSGTHSPTKTSCSATSGGSQITVASTSGFSANDIVFIHQSRGTGAGNWEIFQISSVGAGVLNINGTLANTYTDSGASQSQAIRVPQYSGITTSGTFTLSSWDGNTGGIFVAMCSGAAVISSTISGVGVGYRGGTGGSGGVEICDTGDTGESSLGDRIAGSSTSFGASPSAVGTANGAGGVGGQGKRANDSAAGGGGGAYGAAGSQAEGSIGGSNPAVSGGAGGSTAGSSDLTTNLLFGGGGGGGGKAKDPIGQAGGNGAAGGGIFLLFAREVSVTGSINMSGGAGSNGISDQGGGGGGGGGGAILIYTETGSFGSNLIKTTGGAAGTGHGVGGDGGAGGAGRIHLNCCTQSGSVSASDYGSLTTNTGGHNFCSALFSGMV